MHFEENKNFFTKKLPKCDKIEGLILAIGRDFFFQEYWNSGEYFGFLKNVTIVKE
jgi:hypothetical protein